jgi:hypothetical protein
VAGRRLPPVNFFTRCYVVRVAVWSGATFFQDARAEQDVAPGTVIEVGHGKGPVQESVIDVNNRLTK